MSDLQKLREECEAELDVRMNPGAATVLNLLDMIDELRGENERIAEQLHRISQWANAYPEAVFKQPDLDKTQQVLEAAGISMAGLHGTWGREITEGIRKILEPSK